MPDQPADPAYGTTRARRATVTYGEFERAADALLAQGDKPGLDNVRKAIGGSPQTIRQMLRRYWSELAALKRSPAEALMRLPPEVADLADELWQRSLALAAQSASRDDNAAQERIDQLKRENEVRSHALGVKERTLREREDARDKVTKDLQEHVTTLVSIVSRNSETIGALQAGKAEADARAEDYRQRLAQVITHAVAKNKQASVTRPPPPKPGLKVKHPTAKGRLKSKAKEPARRRPRGKRRKKQKQMKR
jgi:hypothetical protein